MLDIHSFFTLNVGANNVVFGGLMHLLGRYKPSMVFLQEVACGAGELGDLVARMGYKAEVSLIPERAHSLGLGVLWNEEKVKEVKVNVAVEGGVWTFGVMWEGLFLSMGRVGRVGGWRGDCCLVDLLWSWWLGDLSRLWWGTLIVW